MGFMPVRAYQTKADTSPSVSHSQLHLFVSFLTKSYYHLASLQPSWALTQKLSHEAMTFCKKQGG